jgi:signal transduction histidine kinase
MTHSTTSSGIQNEPAGAEALLADIDRLFAAHPLPDAPDLAELEAPARRRAMALLGEHKDVRRRDNGAVRGAARLFYAADVLAGMAIELASRREAARELIGALVEHAGLPAPALARTLLRSPLLLNFPPAVGIEVQLGLLMVLTPLRHVSLLMAGESGSIQAVCHAGEPSAAGSEELARRLLGGSSTNASRGALLGFAVSRWGEHVGALIARPQPGERDGCLPVLDEASPVVGAILERERLISRNVQAERTLAQTHERRLARLGFDIHDGPLQDLALLGEDVHLLRRQLAELLGGDERDLMVGRMDDLDAQLVSLESDLRRISASLQSPFTAGQSLPQALEEITCAFAARSGIEPQLMLDGDLEDLTDSQQMAALSIVREALSNVREHSQATRATVSVSGRKLSIEIQINDDGVGFDVEETIVRAAREGRFGLVGLYERTRLLSGSSHIDSRPGGPTTIAVTLPRWRAVAPEEGGEG